MRSLIWMCYFILFSSIQSQATDEQGEEGYISEYQRMLLAQTLLDASIPFEQQSSLEDPSLHLRDIMLQAHMIVFYPPLPIQDSTEPEASTTAPELWTVSDQMILREEMASLSHHNFLPQEDAPPLTEHHDGVIRVMGQYFKRRSLRQDVDGLIPIGEDNKPLIKRIFEEFVTANLIRTQDMKFYRDFFWEFEE